MSLEVRKRSPYDSKALSSSILSPRVIKTLNKINDPMLKIKRSIERFGKEMIDVAQKEMENTMEI